MSQEVESRVQPAQSNYVKIWEGRLYGQRQGQPVFITKLEGYRKSSDSQILAANWSPVMQIVRLISQDQMKQKQCVQKADFLVFRSIGPHVFFDLLREKKLCAAIQLPSQMLLLSVSDKACRLIGLLFPGDLAAFESSSQEQQLMQQQQHHHQHQQMQSQFQHQQQLLPHLQLQQQLQQQQLAQLQQQLSQLQLTLLQQQQLTQLQQQQLAQLQQQLRLLQLTQLQHQLSQQQQQVQQLPQQLQMVGEGMGQTYVQVQVSSQGSMNIGGEGGS